SLAMSGTAALATDAAALADERPTVSVVNGPFSASSGWGDGIALSGRAFAPDTDYRVELYATQTDVVLPLGERAVRSDHAGTFHVTGWVPVPALREPDPGETFWVAVLPPSHDWSHAARVRLPVVRAPGISAAATSVDAAAL